MRHGGAGILLDQSPLTFDLAVHVVIERKLDQIAEPAFARTSHGQRSRQISGELSFQLLRPDLFSLVQPLQSSIDDSLCSLLRCIPQEPVEEVIAGHWPVDLELLVVLVQLREVNNLISSIVACFTINLEHYLVRIAHTANRRSLPCLARM